jgi:hypothetical protein
MFLGQGLLWQQVGRCLTALEDHHQQPGYSGPSSDSQSGREQDKVREFTEQLRDTLSSLDRSGPSSEPPQRTIKRRRLLSDNEAWERHNDHNDSNGERHTDSATQSTMLLGYSEHGEFDGLPPNDVVDTLVEIYFDKIHPWIPMLHVRQFRQRAKLPSERRLLTNIFHAIISITVRFSDSPTLGSAEMKMKLAKRSRQAVILNSMESFSVENLQALIICAFDIVRLRWL